MKSLLLSLLISLLAFMTPSAALAAPYGEGAYGEDVYNGSGQPASPTPGPTPSPATPAPGKKAAKGSSGSSPSAPGCSAQKPVAVPDLFQIDAQTESVTIYFSPVSGNRDRYYVSYSTSENAEEHGFEFQNDANGVIAVDIHALQTHTTYFFKVRAGNGCQPGDWSNILSVQTGQRFPSYRWSSLPRILSTASTSAVDSFLLPQAAVETATPLPDNSQEPAEQEVAAPAPIPPETQQPHQLKETTQTPEIEVSQAPSESPSFLGRVMGFFKRLFGR